MFQKKKKYFSWRRSPVRGKRALKDKPIVKAQPGNLLYYAVSQHIGAPAVPIVQKGDHVKAGQKIAEAGGFVSAPVYASVSGTVKGIEKKVSAAGSPVDCIVVENDGMYEKEAFEECPHWEKTRRRYDPEEDQRSRNRRNGRCGFPDTRQGITERSVSD